METIFTGGQSSGADSILHGGCGSDGILTTDTEALSRKSVSRYEQGWKKEGFTHTVEEERPGVEDDPALEGCTPTSSEHDKTEEHDNSVLDETPTTTDPVTDDTNANLTGHDTDDLEISDGRQPASAFGSLLAPALRPSGSEERFEVTDTEKDVTFETETGTGKDGIAEVPADRSERVLLHHTTNGLELRHCLFVLRVVDKGESLGEGKVGPVDSLLGVQVIRVGEVAEDLTLVIRRGVANRVVLRLITGLRTVRDGHLPDIGVMMLVVTNKLGHGELSST
jgi:hypothetical protein